MGDSPLSALQQVQEEYGIRTVPIVTIDDLMGALEDRSIRKLFPIPDGQIERMKAYREQYGAKA